MNLLELEHGEGEWENIQDVLRFAFKAIVETQKKQKKQLDRLLLLQQQQQSPLDDVAQTVYALSEQVHAMAQEQQALRSKTNDNAASMEALHKRIQLAEDEIHDLVDLIEKKADSDHVMAHFDQQARVMNEALRKRAKKAMVEQQVAAMDARLEAHMRATVQSIHTHEKHWMEKLQTQETSVEDKLKALEAQIMMNHKEVQEQHTNMVHKVEKRWETWDSEAKTQFTARIQEKIEPLEHEMQRLSSEIKELVETFARERDQMQNVWTNAKTEWNQQLTERLQAEETILETVLTKMSDTVEESVNQVLQTKAKRLKRQLYEEFAGPMHAVQRKVEDLESVTKLVGQQIVEQATQLQSLQQQVKENEPPAAQEQEMMELRAQHAALTQSIHAKLEDYRDLLP